MSDWKKSLTEAQGKFNQDFTASYDEIKKTRPN